MPHNPIPRLTSRLAQHGYTLKCSPIDAIDSLNRTLSPLGFRTILKTEAIADTLIEAERFLCKLEAHNSLVIKKLTSAWYK